MKLHSQEVRKLAPENDPLKIGMGWSVADLDKPQILVESSFVGRLFILDLRGVQKVLEFSSTFCYCSNSWYFESVVLICSSRLLLSCSNKRRL